MFRVSLVSRVDNLQLLPSSPEWRRSRQSRHTCGLFKKLLGILIVYGVAGAAARYLGLRSMMSFLGPMLWGIFLADVVIQMLGTDYARILRAIYAFAQIRITRTYKSPSDIS
ncbi:hypothetical protein RHMOL_Rhmol08G0135400 [Rhododendron molle]|uniref:Uncharacterized protein n=1 Tax=Rhododendron molle TaxID=49168 RepID=A0ACC0MPB1_RHOML|nr:hypothetical protein RHMOL_Rhmol08G0135400 [Rhododendron molle]